MSPWKLPAKYENRNKLRAAAGGFLHHNKQKQKYDRTNKNQSIGVCKHLYNVLFYFCSNEGEKEVQKFADKENKKLGITKSDVPAEISKKDNLSDKTKIVSKDDNKIKDKEKTIQKSMTPKSDKSSSEKSDKEPITKFNQKPLEKSEVKPAQKLSKTSDEKAKPISNIKKTITTTKQTPKTIPNVTKK